MPEHTINVIARDMFIYINKYIYLHTYTYIHITISFHICREMCGAMNGVGAEDDWKFHTQRLHPLLHIHRPSFHSGHYINIKTVSTLFLHPTQPSDMVVKQPPHSYQRLVEKSAFLSFYLFWSGCIYTYLHIYILYTYLYLNYKNFVLSSCFSSSFINMYEIGVVWMISFLGWVPRTNGSMD